MYNVFTRKSLFFPIPLDFQIQRKISVSNADNRCTQLLYIYRLSKVVKKPYEYKTHFQIEELIGFLLGPINININLLT